MIRACTEADFEEIYAIINDAAIAYRGVIPDELWKEPFVSRSYLASEIQAGVTFTGYQKDGALLGVMGTQQKDDVLLIRPLLYQNFPPSHWHWFGITSESFISNRFTSSHWLSQSNDLGYFLLPKTWLYSGFRVRKRPTTS